MPYVVMDKGSRIVGNDTEEFIIKRQERLAHMLIALASKAGDIQLTTALKRLWTGEDTLDLEGLGEPPSDPTYSPEAEAWTLVLLESPYRGVEKAEEYARDCMRDCLLRREAPYASHLLYTQPGVLRDDIEQEREWGIDAGLAWGGKAERTVVYTDLGISEGMRRGIKQAQAENRPVEYRKLPAPDDDKPA